MARVNFEGDLHLVLQSCGVTAGTSFETPFIVAVTGSRNVEASDIQIGLVIFTTYFAFNLGDQNELFFSFYASVLISE